MIGVLIKAKILKSVGRPLSQCTSESPKFTLDIGRRTKYFVSTLIFKESITFLESLLRKQTRRNAEMFLNSQYSDLVILRLELCHFSANH